MNMNTFNLSQNPNCLNDQDNYGQYKVVLDKNDGAILEATSGSGCMDSNIDMKGISFDAEINYESTSENLPVQYSPRFLSSFQQDTQTYVNNLPDYNYFAACLFNSTSGKCLNNHIGLLLKNAAQIYIPATIYEQNISPKLALSLVTRGLQKNSIRVKTIKIVPYSKLTDTQIDLKPALENLKEDYVAPNTPLTQVPKALHRDSYFYNRVTDAFFVYNGSCNPENSYRTAKIQNDSVLLYANGCDNGLSITSSSDPDGFYLWTTRYNVLYGKYPKFQLKLAENLYKNEYLSLNSGYPNLSANKQLQKYIPLPFVGSSKNIQTIENLVNNAPPVYAHTYIYPTSYIGGEANAQFGINQSTENQGIFKVFDMSLTRFPNSWGNIKLSGSERTYEPFPVLSYKKILPSLWGVDTGRIATTGLLKFNESFDQNWGLYAGNIFETVLRLKRLNVNHISTDNNVNAWEMETNQPHTYYIFYEPERLALWGWVVTIATLLISLFKRGS